MGGPWPGPGQPLWTEVDREAVFEYLREEKLLCPGCGHPRDETMDPEAEGHFRARSYKCHACLVGAVERAKYRGDHPWESGGLIVTVEKS